MYVSHVILLRWVGSDDRVRPISRKTEVPEMGKGCLWRAKQRRQRRQG